MLTLRFQRVGKKHDATFRVVAVDSRFSSKSGKVKEVLGWWDPRQDKFELKKERIEYWLKNGAQVSDSCYNLLIKAKIIEGKKRPVVIHKKKVKEGETQIKAEAPKTEEAHPSEVPAEPTIEAPKVKEKIKEEPKKEPKPEETEKPEGKQEEKEESKEEKSEERPKEQKAGEKEGTNSK